MVQSNSIKQICEQSAAILIQAATGGIKEHPPIEIDCSELRDFTYGGIGGDIRQSVEFLPVFTRLKQIKGRPVLYFFEITSETDNRIIIEEIGRYGIKKERPIPAIKTNLNLGSRILYVGRVRDISARLIEHLGYHKHKKNHGLQIYHWTRALPLKLRVHIFEFDPSMDELMPLLEYVVAKKLKPLIGKHKL